MADKINLELDADFIDKFFELTNTAKPTDVNPDVLRKQLEEVGSTFTKLRQEIDTLKAANEEHQAKNENAQNSNSVGLSEFAGKVGDVQKASEMDQLGIPMNYNQPSLQFIDPSTVKRSKRQQFYDDNGQPVKAKILVIDDLGIITYQLEVILKRAGYLPVSSKEIYDAVDKYKRSSFDYVIMDLFIPTEREGFILLEELKKIAEARNEVPIIAVMSASNRKEHKMECRKKGAAFYVEKINDWQKELFGLLLQYE